MIEPDFSRNTLNLGNPHFEAKFEWKPQGFDPKRPQMLDRSLRKSHNNVLKFRQEF